MHLIDIFVPGADDEGKDGPSSKISFACTDRSGSPHGTGSFTKVSTLCSCSYQSSQVDSGFCLGEVSGKSQMIPKLKIKRWEQRNVRWRNEIYKLNN